MNLFLLIFLAICAFGVSNSQQGPPRSSLMREGQLGASNLPSGPHTPPGLTSDSKHQLESEEQELVRNVRRVLPTHRRFNISSIARRGPLPAPSKLPEFHDPYFFPNRSGIVHLHEWKYSDIARECEEYLGPKGYAGVQTSPASENLVMSGRPWYERYQPISYEVRTRSGDAADFLNMTKRCNAAGVRIYVDVVPNHMTANIRNARGTAGAVADPDSFYYPAVPYSAKDFHMPPCAMENLSDPIEARNCELVGLHDLDQSKMRVRWAIILFLDRLTALGATGFRVDASKHMWPEDLAYIYANINDLPESFGYKANSRPFIFQEVGDSWKFNYTKFGAVTEFGHPTNMAAAMKKDRKLSEYENYGGLPWGMLPTESALVFVDNHDLQRQNSYTLNYKMPKEFKMAYAFTLAHPYGIPRVMSSFNFTDDQQGPPADEREQIRSPEFGSNGRCSNGWVCEHRWNAIANMVEFRNTVRDSPLTSWWSDGDGAAAFCRGHLGFLVINTGKKDLNESIDSCLPSGTYCDVISGKLNGDNCTGLKVLVDGNGRAAIDLPKNATEGAIAIHVNSKLN